MTLFWKAVSTTIITTVLIVEISDHEKNFALLISMAASAMIAAAAVSCLEPVVEFIHQLELAASMQGGMLPILLKVLSVGLITEIASNTCKDAGNGSLSKALELLALSVVLYLSLPIMNAVWDLLQQLLGEI